MVHMGGNNQGTEHNPGGEIPHDKEEKNLGIIIIEDGKSIKQCALSSVCTPWSHLQTS